MRNDKQPAILILGTGAMASLFAARLTAAGCAVTMLGTWVEGLNALGAKGVRLIDEQGTERTYPVAVSDNELTCTGVRHAMILVKSWQTARAVQQLAACLSQDGLALTLQNGLGNYDLLAAAVGFVRAAQGVTTAGATLLEPGLVRVGGNGKIMVGTHPRIQSLVNLLRSSGFEVEVVADAQSLIWGKLVINAAINPLTALLRVPNGELLVRPRARNLMGRAAREAEQVAAGLGIQLPYPDAITAVEEVARKTESNLSSMLRDVLRLAPTEIDFISGAVVRAGESCGVPTPVNQLLWDLVKSVETKTEKTGQVMSTEQPGRKRSRPNFSGFQSPNFLHPLE